MKSLRVRLFTVLSMFVIAIAMLIVGVWAIGETQTINLNGSVNFNIADKTLYVKDVRLQQSINEEPSSISTFISGYINGEFNMDIGEISNTYGSFALYFDIINTTSTVYGVTSVNLPASMSGVTVTYEGEIAAGSSTEITDSTPISGSIKITIASTTASEISIDGITINLGEKIEPIELDIQVSASDSGLGSVTGGGTYSTGETVTLQASLNNDVAFLGWQDSQGNIAASELTYQFVLQEDSPTNLTALFSDSIMDEINGTLTPITNNTASLTLGAGLENSYIPSVVNQAGTNYTITELNGELWSVVSSKVYIPSTLTLIENLFLTIQGNEGEDTGLIFVENSQITTLDGVDISGYINTSIYIPASLTTIKDCTNNANILRGTDVLEYCAIIFEDGSNLSLIQDFTNYGTIMIEELIFTAVNPPECINNQDYDGFMANAIYVPDESVELYKTALPEYADYIQGLSTRTSN